jgi:hypothetical protein
MYSAFGKSLCRYICGEQQNVLRIVIATATGNIK